MILNLGIEIIDSAVHWSIIFTKNRLILSQAYRNTISCFLIQNNRFSGPYYNTIHHLCGLFSMVFFRERQMKQLR